MRYQVVFVSRTGNTKKVAMAIYNGISSSLKDIVDLEEKDNHIEEADVYFVGFWVNRGSASLDILEYLGTLEGKKIALFGTCGFGNDKAYEKKIEQQVTAWLPENVQYLGAFFSQGKMGASVRKKYEQMREQPGMEAMADKMIRNYDEGLLHPDYTDLETARQFAKKISEEIG